MPRKKFIFSYLWPVIKQLASRLKPEKEGQKNTTCPPPPGCSFVCLSIFILRIYIFFCPNFFTKSPSQSEILSRKAKTNWDYFFLGNHLMWTHTYTYTYTYISIYVYEYARIHVCTYLTSYVLYFQEIW